jgi:hypothetical protein
MKTVKQRNGQPTSETLKHDLEKTRQKLLESALQAQKLSAKDVDYFNPGVELRNSRQINKQQNIQRSIHLNKYIDKAYNENEISQNVSNNLSPVKKLTPIELFEKLQQQKKREPPKQLLIASH